MSHGEKDENGDQVFLGDDSRQVKVDFVLDLFNNENAKQLQHIPKIFLFQCCRGVQTDIGIQRDGPNAGKNNDDFQEYLKRKIGKPVTGCIERDGPGVRANRSPVYSDQLVAYATHDGFVALRNAENGSWFINAITNIFMEHAKDEHVVDLLTKVNKAVKEKEGQIKQEDGSMIPCKEMSGFVSNLTEKLYLFPGYPPNDEDIEGM